MTKKQLEKLFAGGMNISALSFELYNNLMQSSSLCLQIKLKIQGDSLNCLIAYMCVCATVFTNLEIISEWMSVTHTQIFAYTKQVVYFGTCIKKVKGRNHGAHPFLEIRNPRNNIDHFARCAFTPFLHVICCMWLPTVVAYHMACLYLVYVCITSTHRHVPC